MPFSHEHAPFTTRYGESTLRCLSFGRHEEDNVLVVDCLDRSVSPNPLTRVQSACYTAEIFRSLDCDCHEQLETSLELVHQHGGMLVYMICDGRGAGLLTKVKGLALGASQGLDTHDAYIAMGVEPDPRDYARAAEAIRALGVRQVRLLTNNPRKIDGLLQQGLSVERQPLEIPATRHSFPYLDTKASKMGHMINPTPPDRGVLQA